MQQCFCRHFYSPTYNREILTRTDHINLLATPKGYRWYGPGGELPIKSRAFRGKSIKKKDKDKDKEKEKGEVETFPGMAQFLNDIWPLLTPDILICLKLILMEEFGMTPEAAVLFLMKQYVKTQQAAEIERNANCYPTEGQVDWACNIAGALASKAIQYSEMMSSAKPTKRTRLLNKAILTRLQKALGIQGGDNTPLGKLVAFMVDGLSVWLASLPGENNLESICSDFMSVYLEAPLT